MISGASEEELDLASARADIMIALNEKYDNYDLLNKLDKYQEKEKQQLISWLENKIKEYDEKINVFYETHIDKNCPNLELKLEAFQEVLDFVNKNGE